MSANDAMVRRSGGCLCGAVRYETVGEPTTVVHCHCTLCRRASGAAFVTWAVFPAGALIFTKGAPKIIRSSPKAERAFCGACGTPLWFRYTEGPAEIDVTAANFDEPSGLVPRYAIWASSRVPWLKFDQHLPHYPDDGPDFSPYKV